MPLHLIKHTYGIASVADLREGVARAAAHGAGGPGEVYHSTKSTPSRAAEILGGGSIYWVVKGQLLCRQPVLDIRTLKAEGGSRCYLALAAEVVDVEPRQRKRFLGWRYLEEADAPPDVGGEAAAGIALMPAAMRRELAQLGLL